MPDQLLVREAKPTDVPAIRLLIREFAEFEKLADWCLRKYAQVKANSLILIVDALAVVK